MMCAFVFLLRSQWFPTGRQRFRVWSEMEVKLSVVTTFTTDTGRDWQDGYGDFGRGRNAGVGGIQEGGDAEGLARETRVHFQH